MIALSACAANKSDQCRIASGCFNLMQPEAALESTKSARIKSAIAVEPA
jgi:hypothetical protein